MDNNEDKFSAYTYGEGRTGLGQIVEFSCAPGQIEKVKNFLRENIRDIEIPTTGRVSIAHGGVWPVYPL